MKETLGFRISAHVSKVLGEMAECAGITKTDVVIFIITRAIAEFEKNAVLEVFGEWVANNPEAWKTQPEKVMAEFKEFERDSGAKEGYVLHGFMKEWRRHDDRD